MLDRIILAALAAFVFVTWPASAQQSAQRATYRFSGANVTTFAAAPTDWLVIGGSNPKGVIKITKLSLCGTATSSSTIDVILNKRSSADTAGTSSSATGVAMDTSASPAAPTATVLLYTVNPTLGALIGGPLDAKKLNLGPQGAAGCLFWEFGIAGAAGTAGSGGTATTEPIILRGIVQQLAINLNGVTVPAGTSLTWAVEETEEP